MSRDKSTILNELTQASLEFDEKLSKCPLASAQESIAYENNQMECNYGIIHGHKTPKYFPVEQRLNALRAEIAPLL